VGLLALGEGMPSTLKMQALRLLSWLCITAGVSALAGGKGETSCSSSRNSLCVCGKLHANVKKMHEVPKSRSFHSIQFLALVCMSFNDFVGVHVGLWCSDAAPRVPCTTSVETTDQYCAPV